GGVGGAGGQIAQLDVQGAGDVSGGVFAALAHVEQRAALRPVGGEEGGGGLGAAGFEPGGHAAGEVPGQMLVADFQCLPQRLVQVSVLVLVGEQDQRRVGGQQPAEPGGER